MSRRLAIFTQADIARAIRAAKQAGAAEVEIPTDGATVVIRFGKPEATQAPTGNDGIFQGPFEQYDAGYVYFVECGEFIKIGFSRDVAARVRGIATTAPGDLKVLHTEPGTLATERALHLQFAASHVRREWFRKTDDLLALIEQRRTAGQ